MARESSLVVPKAVPELNIPSSTSTVDVRLIDSTGYGYINADFMIMPHIAGHDELVFPCYSFLISNPTRGSHVLYDLGIRKDWATNYPPLTMKYLEGESKIFKLEVEKNVQDILNEDAGGLGVTSKDISAVILSHQHFDHRGDLSGFPDAEIVVGPGFSKQYLPGYPTNPEGEVNEDDFAGRTVKEFSIEEYDKLIGEFPALDYFGDGSLYLLSAPGHTVGHICALARVSSDSFVLLGGDCAHYCSEFRPSAYLPLPKEINITSGGGDAQAKVCPGSWIQENLHPEKSATEPFQKPLPHVNFDQAKALESIDKMSVFDAADNVLVCIAHDLSLKDLVEFYPKTLNGWKATGVKEKARWAFCADFTLEGS